MFSLLYKNENMIVVSEWMKKELEKSKFKNIIKILNGVDHSLITTKEYSTNPSVLFLGRLEGRKGINLFLETYNFVKKEIPNVEYIIAGNEFLFFNNNPSLKELKKKNKNIKFLGFVSEEQKKELFKKCWLYTAPSRIEGYGISVLEANCAGTYVIGNNVKGLQESIVDKKTGELINCYNKEIFANKIIERLDKEFLIKKENDCRDWAKYHNWENSSNKTKEYLEKLI
jgi:glycosyltransferase involved in cell wall biosynthesis